MEKNSVLKMGRVRLRVRDIDYADATFTPESLKTAGSPSPKKP